MESAKRLICSAPSPFPVHSLYIYPTPGSRNSFYIILASQNKYRFQSVSVLQFLPNENAVKQVSSFFHYFMPTSVTLCTRPTFKDMLQFCTTSDKLRIFKKSSQVAVLDHNQPENASKNGVNEQLHENYPRNFTPSSQNSTAFSQKCEACPVTSSAWCEYDNEKILTGGIDGNVVLWDLLRPDCGRRVFATQNLYSSSNTTPFNLYANGHSSPVPICDVKFGPMRTTSIIATAMLNGAVKIVDTRVRPIIYQSTVPSQLCFSRLCWNQDIFSENYLMQYFYDSGAINLFDMRKITPPMDLMEPIRLEHFERPRICRAMWNPTQNGSIILGRESGKIEKYDLKSILDHQQSGSRENVPHEFFDVNQDFKALNMPCTRRITGFDVAPFEYYVKNEGGQTQCHGHFGVVSYDTIMYGSDKDLIDSQLFSKSFSSSPFQDLQTRLCNKEATTVGQATLEIFKIG